MIVHRYIPYEDSPDPFDPNELMAKVGELIMKYQVDLDEALRLMLASGQVPNLFIKEAGLSDFISDMIRQIEDQKKEILEKYDPVKNLKETQEQKDKLSKKIEKKLDDDSSDGLFRLRWKLQLDSKKNQGILENLDEVLKLNETAELISRAMKRFEFKGEQKIPTDEIKPVLKKLLDMDDTVNALNEALANGDFQRLDLDKLRRALGQEKLEEFLELQRQLVDHMKEILEKNGFIESDTQGGSKVSSSAIDYLSSRALTEFYSHLQSDNAGSNTLDTDGDSEQTTARLKDYEFGDSVSHVDWPASMVNALSRGRKNLKLADIEVYRSRGTAKNAMVVLLDMSGSMYRFDRFYEAKKMILALDKLIKKEYPEDKLEIIGFGSLAKKYSLYELFNLQPFPVIYNDPLIRLQIDLDKRKDNNTDGLPLYFTNLQRGLMLARRLLSSKESKNRQIILITDGVPTAHMEGSVLHLNYPPGKKDFDTALNEARQCREEGIIINTFLLSSEWWESFFTNPGEKTFAHKFVKASGGRFFQSHPHELGVTVLYDFISGQKKSFKNNRKDSTDPEGFPED